MARPVHFGLNQTPISIPQTNFGQRISSLFDDFQAGRDARFVQGEREREAEKRQMFADGVPRNPDGSIDYSTAAARMLEFGGFQEADRFGGRAHQDRSHDLNERQFGHRQSVDAQRIGLERQRLAQAQQGTAELGLNPQYGIDADGNPVLLQLGKHGQAVQTQLPEGVQLSREPIRMDAGTHFVLLDPITRQPVANIPKEGPTPSGFTTGRGDDGQTTLAPIPGGPADIEAQERRIAQEADRTVTQRGAQNVFEDTSRALELVEDWGHLAAGAGSFTSALPATPARTLQKHIDSVKGNIGIDSLLNIKKSGAGLGHIPQAQLDMLASLMGNLDAAQNPEELRFNLLRIREEYADIVRRTGGDPHRIYSARQDRLGGQAAPQQREQPGRLRYNPQTGELE